MLITPFHSPQLPVPKPLPWALDILSCLTTLGCSWPLTSPLLGLASVLKLGFTLSHHSNTCPDISGMSTNFSGTGPGQVRRDDLGLEKELVFQSLSYCH